MLDMEEESGWLIAPFCHLASKEQNAFVVWWCDAGACLPADTPSWRHHEPFVGVSYESLWG